MCEELGIGDVIDQATQQNPEMRLVTARNAVQALPHLPFPAVICRSQYRKVFNNSQPSWRSLHRQRTQVITDSRARH
jgi:hypothetical protein